MFSKPEKIHPSHDGIDTLNLSNSGFKLRRILNHETLGRTRTLVDEILLENLKMARLRVDDGFTQLDKNVLNESTGKDQPYDPNATAIKVTPLRSFCLSMFRKARLIGMMLISTLMPQRIHNDHIGCR